MSNRNVIQQLRPNIQTAPAEHPEEIFQNKICRPILKFQNELLLEIFKNKIRKNKINLSSLSDQDLANLIEKQIKADLKLRHLLNGVVIGLFTTEEYLHYSNFESAMNKRIINLIVKRIQDQKHILHQKK